MNIKHKTKKIEQKGVTLVELMLTLAILAVLAGIALPSYRNYIERVEVALVITDMQGIEQAVIRFLVTNDRYPDSLAEIGINLVDAWGNPYQYLNLETANGLGNVRKDKNLVPINSDFDLYSSGPDGQSVSPLTAKSSRDDIIRANNGGYFGRAEEY